jgi:hypothetical protein
MSRAHAAKNSGRHPNGVLSRVVVTLTSKQYAMHYLSRPCGTRPQKPMRKGATSMAVTPTYAIPPSFLGVIRTDLDADYVVAGVPMDIGTTNRSGTRDGPAAIRRASRMLTDGDHPEH